jgi:Fe-Mn family superoxide dismutase
VAEREGGPHIVITDNNDVVSLPSVQPLFVIDLWEHAYFLDYQFDLERYVEVWLSFLDWEKANARYLSSRT